MKKLRPTENASLFEAGKMEEPDFRAETLSDAAAVPG